MKPDNFQHYRWYREPTKAECEAEMAEVREDYRQGIRDAHARHAQNVKRIRKHRDDMLAILSKRHAAATA